MSAGRGARPKAPALGRRGPRRGAPPPPRLRDKTSPVWVVRSTTRWAFSCPGRDFVRGVAPRQPSGHDGRMGIFDRMGKVISSNVNALLDKADDPKKSLDLLVEEMKDQIRAAKKEMVDGLAA